MDCLPEGFELLSSMRIGQDELLTTFTASAVEFEAMMLDCKPVPVCNVILQFFDVRVFEFNDLPATQADQVIMVFIVAGRFVTRLAITEMALFGNATIGKQLQ